MAQPALPAWHLQKQPLLRAQDGIIVSPGVYDGYSVRMVEKMGFETACTTGAGLSNSRLGVPDVGLMGLTDNLDACRMIAPGSMRARAPT